MPLNYKINRLALVSLIIISVAVGVIAGYEYADHKHAPVAYKKIEAYAFGNGIAAITAEIPNEWNLAYPGGSFFSSTTASGNQSFPKEGTQAFSFIDNEASSSQSVTINPGDIAWGQVDVYAYEQNDPQIKKLYPSLDATPWMIWSKETVAGHVADVESGLIHDGPEMGKTYYVRLPKDSPVGLLIINEQTVGDVAQQKGFRHFLDSIVIKSPT